MAKRQRTLQEMQFRTGRHVDDVDESCSAQTFKSKNCSSKNDKTRLEIAGEN